MSALVFTPEQAKQEAAWEAQRYDYLLQHLVNIPSLGARRAFLEGWERHHGAESTNRLKEDLRRLWRSRKTIQETA